MRRLTACDDKGRKRSVMNLPPLAVRRGTTRSVLLIGPFAIKFGRGAMGRLCNQAEAQTWMTATPKRREMLCPVVWHLPFGLIVIQRRAAPMTEEDAQRRRDEWDFPDWDYNPRDRIEDPTEPKASDWGYLDGRSEPVAIDYGMPQERMLPYPEGTS